MTNYPQLTNEILEGERVVEMKTTKGNMTLNYSQNLHLKLLRTLLV